MVAVVIVAGCLDVATRLRSVAGDRTAEARRRERVRPAGLVRASCAEEMAGHGLVIDSLRFENIEVKTPDPIGHLGEIMNFRPMRTSCARATSI